MKYFLILIILCCIHISKPRYFKRHLRQSIRDTRPSYGDGKKESLWKIASQNNAIKRYFHPNRKRHFIIRNVKSSHGQENKESVWKKVARNNAIENHLHPSNRNHQSIRETKTLNKESAWKIAAQNKRIKKYFHRNNKYRQRIRETKTLNKHETRSNVEKVIREAQNKGVKSKPSAASSAKRIYQALGGSGLLYLLGLILIFIPIVSILVNTIPVVSFCWNSCNKRRKKNASKPTPNDITVEAAILNNKPENSKFAPEFSESYKDMYNNFVSNEFDGEGDTIGKRMKIERWMTSSDLEQKKSKSRPRQHKYYNMNDMEPVKEMSSDFESNLHNLPENTDFPSESDEQNEIEDVPALPRYWNKKGQMKENQRAIKRESQPFHFPDNMVTIGRVYNSKPMNPRNMFSLLDPTTRHPKRVPYSTIF